VSNPEGFNLEVVNLGPMLTKLRELGTDVQQAAIVAAHNEGKVILALSQEQVPVGPTGNLKKSGRVEGPDLDADEITVTVAYGGPAGSGPGQDDDVDYAIYVHENLEMKHKEGQKAKYLEDPLNEEFNSGRSNQRMIADIQKRMKA
jgi:hypothetical protein